MAWNEPGSGKDKDPWSGGNGGKRPQQQPPDLDKLIAELQNKFKKAMGGKNIGGPGQSSGGPSFGASKFSVGLVLAVLFVVYMLSGIYIVKPAERAAVTQFGRFIKEVGPGPHWLPPIIRSKRTVNVEEVHASRHRNRMLTEDENIVFVEMTVQYKVGNLENYLYNVVNPIYSLEEATDSAVRQVVGVSTLDEILTEQRAKIRDAIRRQLEQTLSLYKTGLMITDVAMQPARAPDEVKDAFDDAIKAQEDEQRTINQANAYRMRVIPVAEGHAERISADARAYARSIELKANADVERFELILPEYKKAPVVTRRRMYLDTMQDVFGQINKIIIDSDGGSNVFYLPLDQILKETNKTTVTPAQTYSSTTATQQSGAVTSTNTNTNTNQYSRSSTRTVTDARSRDRTR
jgi:membrane protease subunit HflK